MSNSWWRQRLGLFTVTGIAVTSLAVAACGGGASPGTTTGSAPTSASKSAAAPTTPAKTDTQAAAKPAGSPTTATAAKAASPAASGSPQAAASTKGVDTPQMTLKFNHVVAENTPKGKAALKFAELANQKSNGNITVEVYPNSQLYKDQEEIEALQTGAIHFIAPGADKFGVIAREWEAPALPFIFASRQAADQFMTPGNPVAQELFEKLREKGLLGLAIWDNGWKHASDNKRPLVKPEDFQGLKFRTSGKPDEAFIKAMGGSAQVMPFSEVFSALQQGVVDGQLNTWSNIETQKFHEVQKYFTEMDGNIHLSYGVATNAQWWDSLDPTSRQVLTEAMNEATVYEKEIAEQENQDAYKKIVESGKVEIHKQTPEERAQWEEVAGPPVIEEWEPTVGKEIIEKLRSLQ